MIIMPKKTHPIIERMLEISGESSQSALAAAIGVKQPTWAQAVKTRTGKEGLPIPFHYVMRFTEKYGTSLDELIFGKPCGAVSNLTESLKKDLAAKTEVVAAHLKTIEAKDEIIQLLKGGKDQGKEGTRRSTG